MRMRTPHPHGHTTCAHHMHTTWWCHMSSRHVPLKCPGVLPLARELLGRGTAVVLAANSAPSINDITAPELCTVVRAAAELDGALGRSLSNGALHVVASGSDLPVIDLRRVCAPGRAQSHHPATIKGCECHTERVPTVQQLSGAVGPHQHAGEHGVSWLHACGCAIHREGRPAHMRLLR